MGGGDENTGSFAYKRNSQLYLERKSMAVKPFEGGKEL